MQPSPTVCHEIKPQYASTMVLPTPLSAIPAAPSTGPTTATPSVPQSCTPHDLTMLTVTTFPFYTAAHLPCSSMLAGPLLHSWQASLMLLQSSTLVFHSYRVPACACLYSQEVKPSLASPTGVPVRHSDVSGSLPGINGNAV